MPRRSGSLLCVFLFLWSALAPRPGAAQTPPPGDGDRSSRWPGVDWSYFTTTESLVVLGAAAVTAGWTWEESDENFPALQRSLDGNFLDGPADVGNVYGDGLVIGGLSVGLYGLGSLTGSDRTRHAGVDVGRAFVYSSLVTGGIKYAVNRKRPSGGPLSFPSGHTTAAWSTVPVAWHYTGWKGGAPLTFLAAMTAVGRMEENRHYLSDVLAGAAIGYVVGRAVVRHRGKQDGRLGLVATPGGAALSWKF